MTIQLIRQPEGEWGLSLFLPDVGELTEQQKQEIRRLSCEIERIVRGKK